MDHISTPNHVEDYMKSYRVDSLNFVSENGEKLSFVQTIQNEKKVKRRKEGMMSCQHDESSFVDIELDSEESEYKFIAQDGSEIYIRYFPDVNIHNFDSFDRSLLNDIHYVYRMRLIIKLESFETDYSFGGIAMWSDQSTIDFFTRQLETEYSFQNITYENVNYWSIRTLGPPHFLYTDDYKIIGFIDERKVRWIRIS
ncbi:MAG: hypothetical protein AAFO82_05605 [Bacteroidota bacterium]